MSRRLVDLDAHSNEPVIVTLVLGRFGMPFLDSGREENSKKPTEWVEHDVCPCKVPGDVMPAHAQPERSGGARFCHVVSSVNHDEDCPYFAFAGRGRGRNSLVLRKASPFRVNLSNVGTLEFENELSF